MYNANGGNKTAGATPAAANTYTSVADAAAAMSTLHAAGIAGTQTYDAATGQYTVTPLSYVDPVSGQTTTATFSSANNANDFSNLVAEAGNNQLTSTYDPKTNTVTYTIGTTPYNPLLQTISFGPQGQVTYNNKYGGTSSTPAPNGTPAAGGTPTNLGANALTGTPAAQNFGPTGPIPVGTQMDPGVMPAGTSGVTTLGSAYDANGNLGEQVGKDTTGNLFAVIPPATSAVKVDSTNVLDVLNGLPSTDKTAVMNQYIGNLQPADYTTLAGTQTAGSYDPAFVALTHSLLSGTGRAGGNTRQAAIDYVAKQYFDQEQAQQTNKNAPGVDTTFSNDPGVSAAVASLSSAAAAAAKAANTAAGVITAPPPVGVKSTSTLVKNTPASGDFPAGTKPPSTVRLIG